MKNTLERINSRCGDTESISDLENRITNHSIRKIKLKKLGQFRNSLVVQWLGLSTFTAVGLGLIPGWGTKYLQSHMVGQKKKKKSLRNFWDNMLHSNILTGRVPEWGERKGSKCIWWNDGWKFCESEEGIRYPSAESTESLTRWIQRDLYKNI